MKRGVTNTRAYGNVLNEGGGKDGHCQIGGNQTERERAQSVKHSNKKNQKRPRPPARKRQPPGGETMKESVEACGKLWVS